MFEAQHWARWKSNLLRDFARAAIMWPTPKLLGLYTVHIICVNQKQIESYFLLYRALYRYRSIALLLQVALPVAYFCNGPVRLTLRGGTNAEMAPQIDFITEIFRPNLERFGATFDFDLQKRGFEHGNYFYLPYLILCKNLLCTRVDIFQEVVVAVPST